MKRRSSNGGANSARARRRRRRAALHHGLPHPRWWRSLGPGLVAGGANNDPAGLTTYSVVAATTGFSQLWLLILTTPMVVAVQTICGVVGADTKRGLATLLRLRFGSGVSWTLTAAFVAGNLLAMVADVLILSDTLGLVTGLPRWFFPVLVVYLTWHLLVFHDFRKLMATLVGLNLAFLVYVVAMFVLSPNWHAVLLGSLVPHWPGWGSKARPLLASAAALIGTRLSPYLFFWQASAETERYTDVRLRDQTEFDIAVGMVVSNFIGYCIMVTTATALGWGRVMGPHPAIDSLRQAIDILVPVAGDTAAWLFAIGIIGSGLIALPVMAATSSYAVAETMAWRSGLEKRPWEARRFYIVLSIGLLAVAALSYLPLNPVRVAFESQLAWGLLAPIVLVLLLFLERRRHPERQIPFRRAHRWWLGAATVLTAAILVLIWV